MKLLGKVRRGSPGYGLRVVVYGPEGVGKTTFAASSPAALVLGAESGAEHLDVDRAPEETLATWDGWATWLRELATEDHTYSSVVVDSLDWLEPVIWQHVAKLRGARRIEDVGEFSAGQKAAMSVWREFYSACDKIRERGINVVLVAHCKVVRYSDPAGGEWDRYQLALFDGRNADASALAREWCDHLLFAQYDQQQARGNKWRPKGTGGEARWLHTRRTPAFDAKTRSAIPARIPLEWAEFSRLVDAEREAVPQADLERVRGLAGQLTGDEAARALAAVEKVAKDRAALSRLESRILCRLEDRAERPEEHEHVPVEADPVVQAAARELAAEDMPRPKKRGA